MQATPTPLNQQVIQRIQGWLRTSESIEFRKLIATLAVQEEVEALNELRQSSGDDGFRDKGFDKMDMAKQYEFMLHIMDCAAEGNTPGSPDDKFPYITLELSQPNAAASVEKLLQQKNEQS